MRKDTTKRNEMGKMRIFLLLLLFIPSCLMAQEIVEKMPSHVTKVQNLQDVNVTGDGTFRPWPEGKTLIEQCRKKYQIADSSQLVLFNNHPIGAIRKDSIAGTCQIEIDQLPTYDKLTHQLFGYTKEDTYDHLVEAYQISPENYYSFKDLIFQKTDNSYYFSHKKDKQRQHIHVITELYITEKEYVAERKSIKQKAESPQEATSVLTDFCTNNKIPSLPASTIQALKLLTPYNPANLKDIKE